MRAIADVTMEIAIARSILIPCLKHYKQETSRWLT